MYVHTYVCHQTIALRINDSNSELFCPTHKVIEEVDRPLLPAPVLHFVKNPRMLLLTGSGSVHGAK